MCWSSMGLRWALLSCCLFSLGTSKYWAPYSQFRCPPERFHTDAAMIPLGDSRDPFLPALVSKPPGESPQAQLAIVVVHGAPREVEAYFHSVLHHVRTQQEEAPQEWKTVVIAPGFADKPCTSEQWLNATNQKRTNQTAAIFGSIEEPWWMFGARADRNTTRHGISTFGALDATMQWVPKEYPGVQRIVVFGFSAGGQLLMRWAIMSPEGERGVTSAGLPLRIIVGSASSFAYLSQKRPVQNCTPDRDTGPGHRCNGFRVPHNGSRIAASPCHGDFDSYPFGLSGLDAASASTGVVELGERRDERLLDDVSDYLNQTLPVDNIEDMQSALKARFRSKDVRFLHGRKDVVSCSVGVCFGYCPPMTQGANRLQRGLNFMDYLRDELPGYEPRFALYDTGHWRIGAISSFSFSVWAFEANPAEDMYKAKEGVVVDEGNTTFYHNNTFFPLQTCVYFCETDPNCKSFAYDSYSGYCFLKDKCVSADDPVISPDAFPASRNFKTYYKPCGEQPSVPGPKASEGSGSRGGTHSLKFFSTDGRQQELERAGGVRAVPAGADVPYKLLAAAALAAMAALFSVAAVRRQSWASLLERRSQVQESDRAQLISF